MWPCFVSRNEKKATSKTRTKKDWYGAYMRPRFTSESPPNSAVPCRQRHEVALCTTTAERQKWKKNRCVLGFDPPTCDCVMQVTNAHAPRVVAKGDSHDCCSCRRAVHLRNPRILLQKRPYPWHAQRTPEQEIARRVGTR